MKVFIITCSLLLNLQTVWAQNSGFKQDLNHNWSYSPLMVRSEKQSKVMVKMFKRYLWIENKPIQIAETNFTYLKNPQGKVDLRDLSETIKKSFPEKTLNTKKISNGFSLEGHWRQINRFIKMDLIKKEDHVIIVTSFTRSGLTAALMPELNELHSLLKTYNDNDKKTPKTTFLDFFVPEAHAEGFSVDDVKGLINTSNLTTGANTNLLTTNSTVKVNGTVTVGTSADVNSNWSNTNSNLNELTANVKDINSNLDTNWGSTNTNIEKTTNVLDKQASDMNANWAKTNEAINTNWAESNKISAQMMSPNHMAKVAYYTAAGAALGSITMNLALEGVSVGISYLYELFTGTKKKKLEWQDFEKAIQSWDDQLSDLVKFEQIVDEFIGAFDFFSDKQISNDYIKNLNIAMRDMRFDRDVMMAQFKNEELDLNCRRVLYNAADELDQKLKDYDKIIQFATKNNISINKNQNYFCQQLKELQRKILLAETQMQDLRLAILKAENQFYDKNIDSREKRADNVDDINDSVAKTIKRRQEYNQASSENLKVSFENEREEWVSACIDAKNPEGQKIKLAIDNRFTHFFKAKGLCTTIFENNHSTKKRDEQAQKVFEAENKLRSDLKLSNNDEIDVKLSEEQMNWLTRIHVDAYCYQFAHAEEAKIPLKCQEFPELLYSMNLSKGYEKAKGAYSNRCEERYLRGVERLVGKD